MTFSELLELRLKAVFDSPTDPRFYQNIHAYIDLIMKDEKGRSIIERSEREYTTGHYDIWKSRTNDEDLIDERARQTYKTERFNLYADKFVGLYVRIYLPIEDYVSSDEPHAKSDPNALLMLYGIKSRILDHWAKHRPTFPYRYAKNELKVFNRWFTKEEKTDYERDIKQFHVDFLTAYTKASDTKLESTEDGAPRPPIKLDFNTGDFSYRGNSATLNPTTQEYKVLTTLLTKPDFQVSYLELIQSYRPYVSEPSKSEKNDLYKIVNNLKNTLHAEENELILNVKNIGYRLKVSQEDENTD